HADDGTTMLEGAEFYLAETEADAIARNFLASNGKVYHLDEDGTTVTPALPNGVTLLKSTSDATGKAEFNGLKLEWFTDNPAGANPSDGKQDPNDTSEATWPKVDPGNGDPYISKKYWLVETKSPSGYELIKEPVEVTVTLTSHTDLVVKVENKHETKLPFTGGTGTTLLIIIAIGAITIGTASIAIDKKRRQA
ncbi:MAG: SpaA isopeptide-forming pilin-related protein, partial [Enterococcus hulanensis]